MHEVMILPEVSYSIPLDTNSIFGHYFLNCKWVFKIKSHGVYCTRLIAHGHSQVIRVYFSKIYLSVMNDIIFQTLLLIMIHFGFTAKVAIFLYEEIYMECSPGMKEKSKDDFFILQKYFMALCKQKDNVARRLLKYLKK